MACARLPLVDLDGNNLFPNSRPPAPPARGLSLVDLDGYNRTQILSLISMSTMVDKFLISMGTMVPKFSTTCAAVWSEITLIGLHVRGDQLAENSGQRIRAVCATKLYMKRQLAISHLVILAVSGFAQTSLVLQPAHQERA
jgi:hypothetical protein